MPQRAGGSNFFLKKSEVIGEKEKMLKLIAKMIGF